MPTFTNPGWNTSGSVRPFVPASFIDRKIVEHLRIEPFGSRAMIQMGALAGVVRPRGAEVVGAGDHQRHARLDPSIAPPERQFIKHAAHDKMPDALRIDGAVRGARL